MKDDRESNPWLLRWFQTGVGLGMVGLIAAIWTDDWRFAATGGLVFVASVVVGGLK